MKIASLKILTFLIACWLPALFVAAQDREAEREFFEQKIRPVLIEHCFECHSSASGSIKGGLQLDHRDALLQGGESGPVIISGKPADSELIKALRWESVEMPPAGKLPESIIRDFEKWIEKGAFDPRDAPPSADEVAAESWKKKLAERSQWWSLQPPKKPHLPHTADDEWMKEPVDRFVRSRLDTAGLKPAQKASPEVLLRRLSFTLTGLPPAPVQIESFSKAWKQDPDAAYIALVDELLESPHFGEHFARHWMDVIRYTDTYGYEWDIQAKGSWEFRDYLIRAFNRDIGFDQLVKEQIAGDLLPSPRIDTEAGVQESLIGPMFFHFGERRHGSSLDFNGVHQEMVDSQIDAFSKAFLGMTVACARCHDHKLDAVSQRDYYALAGVFMTPRWTTRCIDTPEKYQTQIQELVRLRDEIRRKMGERWLRELQQEKSEFLNLVRASSADRSIDSVGYPLATLFSQQNAISLRNVKASAEQSVTRLVPEPDGQTIKAEGTEIPQVDSYSIEFESAAGRFRGFQLEALTDSSLGSNGPGRTPHGNFVLSHIRIFAKPRNDTEKREIKIVSATADYEQPGYPVADALTEGSDGWGVGLGGNVNRTASFLFDQPVTATEGTTWTVVMQFKFGSKHTLGKFRLSLGSDDVSAEISAEKIRERWTRLSEQWLEERERRRLHNQAFTSLVDLGRPGLPQGWATDGNGIAYGWVSEATPLIALESDKVISRVLSQGYHTYALSPKFSGAIRLPEPERFPKKFVSLQVDGGEWAGYRSIPQNAFLNEGPAFFDPKAGAKWLSFSSTPLRYGVTRMLTEVSTADLNANFPPRTGVARMGDTTLPNEDSGFDKPSWFSLTGAIAHDQPGTPLEDLDGFEMLYAGSPPQTNQEAKDRIVAWFASAIERFARGHSQQGDTKLLRWLIDHQLLANDLNQVPEVVPLLNEYRRIEKTIDYPRSVNSMDERGVESIDYKLNIRGDVHQEGAAVPRDFLEVFSKGHEVRGSVGSGRLQLAEHLASSDNPQTARVFVNRVWSWIFGKGIVETPNDFGKLGGRPSHPELLDWLTLQFIDEGWSTKKLVRRLLLSETFQQAGDVVPQAKEIDPNNRLLHHYSTRRLEAESIRDSILAVSGRLDRSFFGKPIRPHRSKEDSQKRLFSGPLDGKSRRSIYLEMSVMQPPEFLVGFNLPDLKIPAGQRDVTNVPAQALILLNNPFVMEMAKDWGSQLVRDDAKDPAERIRKMFIRGLGRQPSETELQQWLQAARDLAGSDSDLLQNEMAWRNLAHTMFNTKEFIYYR
jgi:hypothetical protein